MFHMCTLKWAMTLLTGSLTTLASAEQHKVGISVATGQQQIYSEGKDTWAPFLPEQSRQAVHYSISQLLSIWSTRIELSRLTRNTDKISIRDDRGIEQPFAQLNSDRDSLRADVDVAVAIGSVQIHAGGGSTLGSDPYALRNTAAGIRWISNPWGTSASVEVSQTVSKRPASTFLDRDFQSKDRPTETSSNLLVVGVEQLIAERSRVRLEGTVLDSQTERPLALGVRGLMGYALTDSIFVQAQTKLLREQRNEDLRNERGYFSLRNWEVGVMVEPILDLLTQVSFGSQQEDEDDPRVDEFRRLTTQHAGIGLEWSYDQLTLNLGSRLARLGSGEIFVNAQGGITWLFAN